MDNSCQGKLVGVLSDNTTHALALEVIQVIFLMVKELLLVRYIDVARLNSLHVYYFSLSLSDRE